MHTEAKCWALLSRSIPHFLLANHLVVCSTTKRQDLWKKRARSMEGRGGQLATLAAAAALFRDFCLSKSHSELGLQKNHT